MPNEVEILITAKDMSGPVFYKDMANLAKLKAEAAALGKEMKSIGSPDFNTSEVTARLRLLKSQLAALGIADIADINIPIGRVTTQLHLMKRLIQQAGISDLLDVNVNEAQLTSQLAKIQNLSADIPVTFDVNANSVFAMFQKIAAQKAALGGLGDLKIGSIGLSNYVNPSTINALTTAFGDLGQKVTALNKAAAASKDIFGSAFAGSGYTADLKNITGLGAAMLQSGYDAKSFAQNTSSSFGIIRNNLNSIIVPFNSVIGSGGAAGSGGGGGAGLLGLAAASGWFGKKFGATFAGWGTKIGGIGLWHVALDGAIEAVIIATSGLAALAAGMDALMGTGQNLYTHLTSVYKVNAALGSQIPPLTDRFVALQKSLAPQGIEIFGQGLLAIQMQSGSMAKAMVPVVNLFDNFAAKIVLWEKGFGSTGKIFTAGIGFLSQLGHIFGTLGMGIGNLVKDDPGIARMLLDIIQGTMGVFNWLTKLPGPLVAFALGLHGAYVWGSVIAGLLGRLGGQFAKMYKTLSMFATNPLAWAAVAAIGLGYLAYKATQADNSTKQFIDNMNTGLSELSGQQAFDQSVVDIGRLNTAIKNVNWHSIQSQWSAAGTAAHFLGYDVNKLGGAIADLFRPGQLGNAGRDFISAFSNSGPAMMQAKNNIDAYLGEETKLMGQQKTMIATMGGVRNMGFSVSQSWALLTVAGVKMGDSFQLGLQKVKGLIQGYNTLSIRGGILANSVNAITFQSLQQQSQVTALNQGWDTFFNTVNGGESGFAAFLQNLGTLHSDAKAAGASMTGLNGTSVALRTQFTTTASSANTLMDNITLLDSAAGLGKRGTEMLTQATKDLVASQLPAARSSVGMTSVLYALAQRGGYQGADSFQALSKWVGNTQHPMSNLNTIVGFLTKSAGNLTRDVRNLSDALGVTLNNAMSTAIFAASGGQKTFDNFANAVLNSHGNIRNMIPSAQKLADELYSVTGSASQTKAEFVVFSEGMGMTKAQADKLWGSLHHISADSPYRADVNVSGSGSGGISVKAQGAAYGRINGGLYFGRAAQGMLVTGGTPGQDSVPILAMPGEAIVPTNVVPAVAPILSAHGVPGFAKGGLVGHFSNPAPWAIGKEGTFEGMVGRSFAQAAVSGLKAAVLQASKAAAGGMPLPGGGAPAANAALARRMMPAWANGLLWADWNNVAMRESGWNQFATNPSSGAYGIPQALPPGKMGRYALPPYSNPGAQIGWMINYIQGRYGNPINAWAHEVNYGWYDNGGWLKPGYTLAYNGTGKPERVGGGGNVTVKLVVSTAGNSNLEKLFVEMIQNFVRVHAGGDVQAAFGSE